MPIYYQFVLSLFGNFPPWQAIESRIISEAAWNAGIVILED